MAEPEEKSNALALESSKPDLSQFDPILQLIPKEKQGEAKSMLMFTAMSSYRGPLPPPGMLEKYGKIVPDFPERIVKNWESETTHRHEMERLLVNADINRSGRGQMFGFILAILFLVVAAYLGIEGHDWLAGTIGTSSIIAIVTIFVLGKSPDQKEESEKQKPAKNTLPAQNSPKKSSKKK